MDLKDNRKMGSLKSKEWKLKDGIISRMGVGINIGLHTGIDRLLKYGILE